MVSTRRETIKMAPGNLSQPEPEIPDETALKAAESHSFDTMEESPDQAHVAEVAARFHNYLRGEAFSCIGGRAASVRDVVVHRHYRRLADAAVTRRFYNDLERFALERHPRHEDFAVFAATFDSPRDMTEKVFEHLLWRQLQILHEIDRELYEWAPGFESDAMADHFAYSIAAHPFFIVGLHSNASRLSRRFDWPALAFNSHVQFQRLRESGRMQRIRKIVRRRELALQGSLNPRLIDFGFRPESIRYSGREVEPGWRCPFRVAGAYGPDSEDNTGPVDAGVERILYGEA